METLIKPKFNINNLVAHKFQRNDEGNSFVAYEVIEIITQTCYAGTQIFYDCRGIVAQEVEHSDGKYIVGFHLGKDKRYERLREDEVIDCPQHWIDRILGNLPKV